MNKLTPEMVGRVGRLNTFLTEAADWVEERARKTRAAYLAGGGPAAYQMGNGHWEDYELTAIIKCSLGGDYPGFDPFDEYSNLVAVAVENLKPEDGLKWSDCAPGWGEGLRQVDAFRTMRFCYLFHDLFEHQLRGDLDSLASIGEIEINLVLARQRGLHLEAWLPPRSRETPARSVFNRTPGLPKPLNSNELSRACQLNDKIREANYWIHDQAERGEKEYEELGGRDRHFTEDAAYEDYEMAASVCGCLGENHPEYDEEDDNIIVEYSEPIGKKNQRVFGRSRSFWRHRPQGEYFQSRFPGEARIPPCGLFEAVFEKTGRDWLKMLSIGQLWLDFYFLQRRIVQVSGGPQSALSGGFSKGRHFNPIP